MTAQAFSFPVAQGAWDRKKMKQWHEQLLEDMVLCPLRTYKEHAQRFDVSEVTISQVTRSDLFKARLAEMMAERDKLMVERIGYRMDRAIESGLEKVQEALEDDDCAPDFALSAVVALDKRRRPEPGRAHGLGGTSPLVSVTINAAELQQARAVIHAHARSETGPADDSLLSLLD